MRRAAVALTLNLVQQGAKFVQLFDNVPSLPEKRLDEPIEGRRYNTLFPTKFPVFFSRRQEVARKLVAKKTRERSSLCTMVNQVEPARFGRST